MVDINYGNITRVALGFYVVKYDRCLPYSSKMIWHLTVMSACVDARRSHLPHGHHKSSNQIGSKMMLPLYK